jgi:hypothetical protein
MQYSVLQFPLLQHLAGMLGHGKRHRGLQSRPLWSGATLSAVGQTPWLIARRGEALASRGGRGLRMLHGGFVGSAISRRETRCPCPRPREVQRNRSTIQSPPPNKPMHDPAGDPTFEPPQPLTEPTPNPASDPPPEMPGDPPQRQGSPRAGSAELCLVPWPIPLRSSLNRPLSRSLCAILLTSRCR